MTVTPTHRFTDLLRHFNRRQRGVPGIIFCFLFPLLAGLFVVTVSSTKAQAAQIMIDSFETSQDPVVANGGNPSVFDSVAGGADILGGVREVTVQYNAGPGQVQWAVAGGVGTFSEDMDTDGSVSISYNFGGGIDLTAGGQNDRFLIDIPAPKVRDITITIIDPSDTHEVILSVNLESVWIVSYSAFPAADFTDVQTFEITILPDMIDISGSSFGIDSIRAVPEPSTLTLCSLGTVMLVGLGWRRRKRTA